MFMRGCPPELEAKRHRINCRELVVRNLLALAAGVRRTVCWNLAPDIPGYEHHLSVMDLLFGKLALLDYEGAELSRRHPAADTFALLASQLAGVEGVVRVEVPAGPACRCSRWSAAAGTRCWSSGTSATPSPARTTRRCRSSGPGRRPGPPPSTPTARPSRPRCSTAACACRSPTPRCS
jgi:hypothetical protein